MLRENRVNQKEPSPFWRRPLAPAISRSAPALWPATTTLPRAWRSWSQRPGIIRKATGLRVSRDGTGATNFYPAMPGRKSPICNIRLADNLITCDAVGLIMPGLTMPLFGVTMRSAVEGALDYNQILASRVPCCGNPSASCLQERDIPIQTAISRRASVNAQKSR